MNRKQFTGQIKTQTTFLSEVETLFCEATIIQQVNKSYARLIRANLSDLQKEDIQNNIKDLKSILKSFKKQKDELQIVRQMTHNYHRTWLVDQQTIKNQELKIKELTDLL